MKRAKPVTTVYRGDVVSHIYRHKHDQDVMTACNITRQALSQWTKVPVRRVLAIEKVTGIPRHLIRGDIYPAP